MANLNLSAGLRPSMAVILASASIATLVAVLRLMRSSTQSKPLRRTIPSPRDTLIPFMSGQQAANLPYPPKLLPGARDVSTPYGTMRVYEWGPADGKKVIFVHGDTTPAPVFALIADGLMKRGCRVIVFGMSHKVDAHFP